MPAISPVNSPRIAPHRNAIGCRASGVLVEFYSAGLSVIRRSPFAVYCHMSMPPLERISPFRAEVVNRRGIDGVVIAGRERTSLQ
jgi:hypothetical protein